MPSGTFQTSRVRIVCRDRDGSSLAIPEFWGFLSEFPENKIRENPNLLSKEVVHDIANLPDFAFRSQGETSEGEARRQQGRRCSLFCFFVFCLDNTLLLSSSCLDRCVAKTRNVFFPSLSYVRRCLAVCLVPDTKQEDHTSSCFVFFCFGFLFQC